VIADWSRLSDETDASLRRIFDDAVEADDPKGRLALLAVGGYGRRELAPFSDLDLLLVHEDRTIEPAFAQMLWYPLWDAGRNVGHAVRCPKATLQMIRNDLDTATALMTARVVAGDERFGASVIEKCQSLLRKQGRRWLAELHARVLERHRTAGEVAYLLEPDLKEGLGVLRHIQPIWWARAVGFVISGADAFVLGECNSSLLRIRAALHCTSGWPGDVLHLQDQLSVAREAGFRDDDELMATIALVGRQAMFISEETLARLDPPRNRQERLQPLAPGVELVNGEVRLADNTDPVSDPTLVLR
jgi:[protein-PII] uridylyltransferase